MKLITPLIRYPLLAAACLLAAGAAAAQPRIHVEPEVLDLGRMNQQETRQGEVTISNHGDAPLEIGRVGTDCGCTAARPKTSVLQPGESTPLVVEFNSKSFEGDQMKTIRIQSNDPDHPEVQAFVQAYVHVALRTLPKTSNLSFAQIRQGDSPTRVYEFIATEEPELQIELDRYDPDLFQVEVLNHYEDDPQRAALRVTVPSDMPVGDHKDIMRVTTNVPSVPSKDIDVRVRVVLDLTVFPDRIHFRYVKPEQRLDRKYVRVSPAPTPSRDEPNFSITGADVDLPGLKVEVEETQPGREYFVWVSGKALAKNDPRLVDAEGRMRGTLRIHTTLASQPLIEVPVLYMVRL